jgi:hypothetical protein
LDDQAKEAFTAPAKIYLKIKKAKLNIFSSIHNIYEGFCLNKEL